jgi:hypothetical protein
VSDLLRRTVSGGASELIRSVLEIQSQSQVPTSYAESDFFECSHFGMIKLTFDVGTA